MSVSWDEKLKLYIFQCPHCKEFCAVSKDDGKTVEICGYI